MNEPTTQALTPQRRQPMTLRAQLESETFRQQVARALPKHLTPDRFIRVAATAIMRTPSLADCDQVSFFNCLLTLSQFGLEPDGRRAHLIPFRNNKRNCVECQLIIDYKGLAELAMRSGVISYLHADVVCEADAFDYDRGAIISHRIDFRKPRGKPYAAYALARFKDSTEKSEVMSVEDIESIRRRSRAGQSGPWVTDWNEMAKKTAFRRLSKWLPLSPEFRDAIDADVDAPAELPTIAEAVKDAPPVFLPPPAPTPEAPPETAGETAPRRRGRPPGAKNRAQSEAEGSADQQPQAPAETEAPSGQDEPPTPPTEAEIWMTPQARLAKALEPHSFDYLKAWNRDVGFIPDLDSVAGFDDLTNRDAERLLNVVPSLRKALAAAKGGAQ